MRKYETYTCLHCANAIEIQNVGGGEIHCCGEKMNLTTKSLTLVNLMKAFSGESEARNKYDYFAKVAQKEGYRDIAEHFTRAANNEKTHAKLELSLYNRIVYERENNFATTKENLQEAIDGESYENTNMYPEFAAIAKEEQNKEAEKLFKSIGRVEVEHEKMFQKLLNRLQKNEEFISEDKEEAWICEICGHVHYGKKALKNCPVCNHPEEYQSRMITDK